MTRNNQLDDQRVVQICLAHLTAAINISKKLREVGGDASTQAAMISPLLVLSSDLLVSSVRYEEVGIELSSFALSYSLRVADERYLGSDGVVDLTNRLEDYIDDVLDIQYAQQSGPLPRSVQ